jgi:hypothetical protein
MGKVDILFDLYCTFGQTTNWYFPFAGVLNLILTKFFRQKQMVPTSTTTTNQDH